MGQNDKDGRNNKSYIVVLAYVAGVYHEILIGIWIPVAARDFSLLRNVRTGFGGLPILLFIGFLYRQETRPEREANHSSPSSAGVKNEWSHIFTPTPYSFVAWTGTALPSVFCKMRSKFGQTTLETEVWTWIFRRYVVKMRNLPCRLRVGFDGNFCCEGYEPSVAIITRSVLK